MDISIVQRAPSQSWLPLVQIGVTAFSALISLAAASIAANAYFAGRKDKIRDQIEAYVKASTEAYRLVSALERAEEAFRQAATEDRDRIRASALAELRAVSPMTVWPAEIDRAHIEGVRLVEDRQGASSQVELDRAKDEARRLASSVETAMNEMEQSLEALYERLRPRFARRARGEV